MAEKQESGKKYEKGHLTAKFKEVVEARALVAGLVESGLQQDLWNNYAKGSSHNDMQGKPYEYAGIDSSGMKIYSHEPFNKVGGVAVSLVEDGHFTEAGKKAFPVPKAKALEAAAPKSEADWIQSKDGHLIRNPHKGGPGLSH